MSWTVSKDGLAVLCETEAELLIAIAAIRQAPDPAWRVGGPSDPKPLSPIVRMGDGTYQHEDGTPLTDSERATIAEAYVEHLREGGSPQKYAGTGQFTDETMRASQAHV